MGYQALLFCPDEKAARGVTQVLSELDFTVEPCTEPFAAVKKLMAQHFDAIVVDCDNEQNATLLFKSARNSSSNQSSLAVAVVEGQAGVAKAFRIGANLVLTKPINIEQAKGTLRVARGLLRKGGEVAPKPAAEPTATPAGAPVSATPTPVANVPKPVPSAPRPAQPAVATQANSGAKAWPNPQKNAAPARAAQSSDSHTGSGAAAAADTAPKIGSAPKTEAPSKTVKPAAAAPGPAPQAKYPWQATKPGAEPMASALKKAAEAAGIAAPPAPQASRDEAAPLKPATTPATHGAAAAPAPAKEKLPAPAPVPTPVASSIPGRAAVIAPEESTPAHLPAPVEKTFYEETHAPSFSMGAPAVDEEEPANSKKAIIILAIVVILGSMAGYLGWKNMSGKSPAPTQAPQVQAPPAAPTQSPSSGLPVGSDSTTVSAPATTSAGSSPEPVTAPPAKPSARTIAKDTTRSVAPAAANPADIQPSVPAPALVVHNESSKPATKPTAATDADSAPAPSALGLTSNQDPNALSAIGNAPVAVPKASAQVVKLSQGVSEGLILKKVSPRYPAQALQMHVEGSVQMQATIGKDGSISNVKILSGDPLLAHSAQEAVKQWKYKPYYLDGEPVDIQTQITINFKLPR